METLSIDEVLAIHEALTQDFNQSNDPISPPGVRSLDLLSSAVSRQYTGYEGKLKYDTISLNAASLTYGVCLNHPFHNGNKRTALVSMLCHLDKNEHTFDQSVDRDDLYKFMIKTASHGFSKKSTKSHQADQEVEEMAHWIRKRLRRVERGERVITFRELKSILEAHGFKLDNHKNNSVDVVRYVEKSSFFGLRKNITRERIMRISYPGDGKSVGKGLLRDLRERCKLTEENGIDSKIFYAKERPMDRFIQEYRKLLRLLAKV